MLYNLSLLLGWRMRGGETKQWLKKNLRNFSNWHAKANANEFDYTWCSTHSIYLFASLVDSQVWCLVFGVRVQNAWLCFCLEIELMFPGFTTKLISKFFRYDTTHIAHTHTFENFCGENCAIDKYKWVRWKQWKRREISGLCGMDVWNQFEACNAFWCRFVMQHHLICNNCKIHWMPIICNNLCREMRDSSMRSPHQTHSRNVFFFCLCIFQ